MQFWGGKAHQWGNDDEQNEARVLGNSSASTLPHYFQQVSHGNVEVSAMMEMGCRGCRSLCCLPVALEIENCSKTKYALATTAKHSYQ